MPPEPPVRMTFLFVNGVLIIFECSSWGRLQKPFCGMTPPCSARNGNRSASLVELPKDVAVKPVKVACGNNDQHRCCGEVSSIKVSNILVCSTSRSP
jgi:hypothetical protein